MRYQGKIVEWNDAKAFGFVLPNAGGSKIFVHLNEFSNRGKRPQVGTLITFEMGLDASRRSCAVNAEMVESRREIKAAQQIREAREGRSTLSIWLAGAWVILVVAMAIASRYSWKVIAAWAAINAVTLALYAADKAAAKRGGWRTPEAHLHLLALVGGWPAAAYAQRFFRHKTSKETFRATYWLTVIANIGLMLWLATPSGRIYLSGVV
jgi:uncharacterized membrane protein YsdA (DUF1294 family)/cold shock CspA family protein